MSQRKRNKTQLKEDETMTRCIYRKKRTIAQEFNIAPQKLSSQKGEWSSNIFQPSSFRGYIKLPGRILQDSDLM